MRQFIHSTLTILLTTLSLGLFAQPSINLLSNWDYERKSSKHEKINQVIPTSHGYVIAVGETLSSDLQHLEGLFLVIKVEDGSEVKRKVFGGPGDQSFNAVIQNHNGTFTLVGYDAANKKEGKNKYLVQVDWYGKVISEQRPDANQKMDDEFLDIAIDEEGTSLLIAKERDRKQQQYQVYKLENQKIERLGITSQETESFVDISAAPGKGFILLGNTSVSNREHPEDIWVRRINTTGQDIWRGTQYFGDAGLQEGMAATACRDGGIAIVGVNNTKSQGLSDYWLIKLRPDGTKDWDRSYGRKFEDIAGSVAELSFGGFAVLGHTKSYMPKAPTTQQELIITGPRGQELERKSLPIYSADGNEIGHSVFELFNGNLIVAGNDIDSRTEATLYIGAYAYRSLQRNTNPNSSKSGEELFGSSKGAEGALQISEIRFFDANGNSLLETGERGYLALEIRNTSGSDFNNVSGKVSFENQNGEIDFWRDNKLGSIKAGETKKLRVPLHAQANLKQEAYQVQVNLDANGTYSGQKMGTVRTSQMSAPANLLVQTKQFFPAKPKPGQRITLKVELVNSGGTASQRTTANFGIQPGIRSLESERVPVPSIPPRGKYTLSFSFTYNENYPSSTIPISMESGILKQTFYLPVTRPAQNNAEVAKNTRTNGGVAGDEIIWASHEPNQSRGGIDVNNKEVDVKAIALSKNPLQKRNFNMLINGKRTKGQKNFGEVDLTPPNNNSGRNRQTYTHKVQLNPGRNEVRIIYQHEDGSEVLSPPLTFNYIPKDQPNLHVLSIGVAHEDLKYTVKDAKDIYRAFDRLRGENGFKRVIPQALIAKEYTTGRAIKTAFTDLSRRNIKENDLVVVFMSSHGKVSQRGRYILLPSDFDPSYEEDTGIDFKQDVLNKLDMINANVLVLIDACQSGSAYGARSMISNEAASVFMNKLINNTSGMEIIASCGDREYSYEDDQWRNGAFTKAILEAFQNVKVPIGNGKTINADIHNELEINNRRPGSDGIITIEELRTFIGQRVPYLVKSVKDKAQNPSHKSTERLSKSMGIYMVN